MNTKKNNNKKRFTHTDDQISFFDDPRFITKEHKINIENYRVKVKKPKPISIKNDIDQISFFDDPKFRGKPETPTQLKTTIIKPKRAGRVINPQPTATECRVSRKLLPIETVSTISKHIAKSNLDYPNRFDKLPSKMERENMSIHDQMKWERVELEAKAVELFHENYKSKFKTKYDPEEHQEYFKEALERATKIARSEGVQVEFGQDGFKNTVIKFGIRDLDEMEKQVLYAVLGYICDVKYFHKVRRLWYNEEAIPAIRIELKDLMKIIYEPGEHHGYECNHDKNKRTIKRALENLFVKYGLIKSKNDNWAIETVLLCHERGDDYYYVTPQFMILRDFFECNYVTLPSDMIQRLRKLKGTRVSEYEERFIQYLNLTQSDNRINVGNKHVYDKKITPNLYIEKIEGREIMVIKRKRSTIIEVLGFKDSVYYKKRQKQRINKIIESAYDLAKNPELGYLVKVETQPIYNSLKSRKVKVIDYLDIFYCDYRQFDHFDRMINNEQKFQLATNLDKVMNKVMNKVIDNSNLS